MRKQYDQQLERLNAELIRMGEMIITAIGNAVSALVTRDDGRARETVAYDEEIDHQERLVEQLCMKLLLCQQPVAGDLRLVSAALKMITDMERIGDHAADISEIELALEKHPVMNNAPLRDMASETSEMLMKSIESFVERDLEKARWVIARDDTVDALFDAVKQELIRAIRVEPACGGQAADLLMAAKYFERIGDHATNIAEWAIFAVTGRHEGGQDTEV